MFQKTRTIHWSPALRLQKFEAIYLLHADGHGWFTAGTKLYFLGLYFREIVPRSAWSFAVSCSTRDCEVADSLLLGCKP